MAASRSCTSRRSAIPIRSTGQLVLIEKGVLASSQASTINPVDWVGFDVQTRTAISYNAIGLKVEERVSGDDASGNFVIGTVTQFSYDADGRLTCTAVRMNLAQIPATGGNACVVGTPGEFGADRISRQTYDTADQLIQIRKGVGTNLDQAYATYSYTPSGQRDYIVDANGNRARTTYDDYDRLYRWYFPSPTAPTAFNDNTPATALSTAGAINNADYEQFTYDENDNITADRKRDTRIVGSLYDNLNRRYLRRYQSNAGFEPQANWVHYGYDLRGLQTFARFGSDTGSGIASDYDKAGRLTQTTDNLDGAALTLGYQYDKASNRQRLTYPDATFYTYLFDPLNRMTSIKRSGTTSVVTIGYDDRGQRAGLTAATGATVDYDYDPQSRLMTLTHTMPGAAANVTFGFAYTPASQLASRTRSNDAYAYVPPVVSTQAYQPNGLNQYKTVGGAVFAHDASGNLASDGTTAYAYDVENRLLSATGAKTATLSYDPQGRLHRTQGAVAASATRLLYDGDALVAEYNMSGTLLRRYVHGPRGRRAADLVRGRGDGGVGAAVPARRPAGLDRGGEQRGWCDRGEPIRPLGRGGERCDGAVPVHRPDRDPRARDVPLQGAHLCAAMGPVPANGPGRL